MAYPPGSYPFGYHCVNFGERYTNMGAEASMIFIGPSLNRFDFLRSWFPHWWVTSDPETGVCCVDYVVGTGPTPYPDLGSVLLTGIPPDVVTVCESNDRQQLWPDTFSIAPFDETCTPYPIECIGIPPPTEPPEPPAPPTIPLPIERHPLYYGGTNSGDECFAEVTINFRRKAHAGWPYSMYPCNFAPQNAFELGQTDFWRLPDIPWGTYIEVVQNPAIELMGLESDGVKYKVDETYQKNTLPGTWPFCAAETIGVVSDPSFCNPNVKDIPALQPEDRDKIVNEQVVFAEALEVRWTNVPMANWQAIRTLRGRVNSTIWLGHPPEAVRFSGFQVDEAPSFGGVDLYNITYRFDIREAPVEGASDATKYEHYAKHGVYNGMVGLWNRVWSKEPMRTNTPESGVQLCLNWIPIRQAITSCCSGNLNPKIYPADCLNLLFQVPTCPLSGAPPEE